MKEALMDEALVLIIDDVPEIVDELVTMLSLLDIPALGAGSLSAAVTALENAPALRAIACDVRLAQESGLEILQRISDHPELSARSYHFLFMTGDPMRPDAIHAQQKYHLLSKPVQPRQLIEILQELLAVPDTTHA